VLGIADRVLVISEGHVVHHGPATELTESDVLDMVMTSTEAAVVDPHDADATETEDTPTEDRESFA
jgi:ABC-type sugar transport system ATPase subunit